MGMSFAVIVFLQHVLNYSPLQVGFLLLPATLGRVAGELTAAISPITGAHVGSVWRGC